MPMQIDSTGPGPMRHSFTPINTIQHNAMTKAGKLIFASVGKMSGKVKTAMQAVNAPGLNKIISDIYKMYIVKEGDSLRNIAKKEYGDENLWPVLYFLNKTGIKKSTIEDIVRGLAPKKYERIKNPDLIYPGQKFIIPSSKAVAKLLDDENLHKSMKFFAETLKTFAQEKAQRI